MGHCHGMRGFLIEGRFPLILYSQAQPERSFWGGSLGFAFPEKRLHEKPLKAPIKNPRRGTDKQKHRAAKASRNCQALRSSPSLRGALCVIHSLSTGKKLHFPGLHCSPCWELRTMGVILASSLPSTEIMEPVKEPLGIFA